MSRDHLKPTQFKPGQSGNPSGRSKLTPEERKLRESFGSAMGMLHRLSMGELKQIAEDDRRSASEVIVAKAVLLAVDKGNASILIEIFNRAMGKVKEHLEIENPYGNLSKKEFIQMAKERIAEIEGEPE